MVIRTHCGVYIIYIYIGNIHSNTHTLSCGDRGKMRISWDMIWIISERVIRFYGHIFTGNCSFERFIFCIDSI